MSLLGRGIVALWNDIAPEGRDEFYEWHNREHLPERVAVPGFIRSRRYIARQGAPEYFTLHEAKDTDVLVGADYLAQLNSPTPWTQKVIPIYFRNVVRGICRVAYSQACGDGADLAVVRFGPSNGREAEFEAALCNSVLPPVNELAGVVGVHLCITEIAASEIEAIERAGQATAIPNWLILIEGITEAHAATASEVLMDRALQHAGCGSDVDRALYAMQIARVTSTKG